jgi:Tol biopolymer transport system component
LCNVEGESMKRSWTALAVTLFAAVVLTGCNDYNNSVQYDTGATLTNLSPSGLPSGAAPVNAAQCQTTTNGPTFPCFTLYVIASPSNPFTTPGTPPLVQWNQQKLVTTFIDTTNLSAQVPYSLLSKPGSVAVNVYQPTGQGTGYNGLSNALTFTVYGSPNPYPSLTSITPTSGAYCDSTSAKCAGIQLTLNGAGFIPVSQNGGSSVTVTGDSTYGEETAINVNSISSTQLKATIPGTLLCASGTVAVNVLNPPSAICLLNCPNLGGGDTNNPPAGSGGSVTTQYFTVTNSSSVNTCPANVPPGTTTTNERPAISQDGRYVSYASADSGTKQILLRDTCLGAGSACVASTRTVSVAADGTSGNADSHDVSMTPDGRYVVFSSAASNLTENPPAGPQIYVRDTCNGAKGSCTPNTQMVSTDEAGKLSGLASVAPSISASGRYVAFVAETLNAATASGGASNVNAAAGSIVAMRQVFVRDTCVGAANCTANTIRVSVLPGSSGTSALGGGATVIAEEAPSVSQDGRYVAYTGVQGNNWQILMSDTCRGAGSGCTASTRTVSSAVDGLVGNAASHNAVITADGRYIAFSSAATNLIANAPVGRQVYLRDTCAGADAPCQAGITLVSTDETGQLTGTEGIYPSVSANGRYVAFLAVTASQSASAKMAPNSGLRQVFVRDTCMGASNCTAAATRISMQPGDSPVENAKPAGPALAGLAKQVALPDGKSSTVFTPTVAVDERVVIAIPTGSK